MLRIYKEYVKIITILLILLFLFTVLGCRTNTITTTTTTTTTTVIGPDNCPENDIGNGNTIISGPSAPTEHDPDSVFRALSVHPTDPNTVYLGTETNGLVKSTDGGSNWTRLRKGISHGSLGTYPEVYDISIAKSTPEVLYISTVGSPGPVIGASSGVYKSSDEGATWIRRNYQLQNARMTCINVDPTDPNIVVLGISGGYSTDVTDGNFYDGGIFRSSDGGANWTQITTGSDDDKNQFSIIKRAKNDSNKLYTFGFSYAYADAGDASLNLGFLKSTDNGLTWVSFALALKSKWVNYFDLSSDGNTIYAGVPDDYKIYKSTDGGDSWDSGFIVGTSCYAIAVSPSDPNRVLYGTVDKFYLSTDGLQSSAAVLSGLSTVVDDIVFAPSDNTIVYAVMKGYLLYKSTDSGASFSLMKNIRDDVLNVIP